MSANSFSGREAYHKNVTKRLEIISSRLLNTEVGVDRGVSSGTGQVFVLSVRNVQVRLGVTVLFGETKVDDIDLVTAFADTHEEIVGLNVAVNEVARVDVLNSGDLYR